MSEWSRQHDALIAERAEGLKVTWVPVTCPDWVGPVYYDDQGREKFIDHYLTDLAASARAQEAWRMQEPEKRTISIYFGPSGVKCEMHEADKPTHVSHNPKESEARAWATWGACWGIQ